MTDYLKQEGRLALLEKDVEWLKTGMTGYMKSVRNILDPNMTEKEMISMDARFAADQTFKIAEFKEQLVTKADQIRKLRHDLGKDR